MAVEAAAVWCSGSENGCEIHSRNMWFGHVKYLQQCMLVLVAGLSDWPAGHPCIYRGCDTGDGVQDCSKDAGPHT